MKDAYGRALKYLRVSVTDRCNLRCRYCMPAEGIEKIQHQEVLSLEAIETMVRAMANLGVEKVRLTGGEPLIRNGIVDLVSHLNQIPGIKELVLTTNGLKLASMAADLKAAGLKRVNISLDTLDPVKFEYMTRGGKLQDVLDAIEAAKQVGLTPIKINVVLIQGFNDDEISRFVEWTRTEPIEIRFIELMPIGEVASWSSEKFMSNGAVLERVPELSPCQGSDPASPATMYQLQGGKGRVGLISPISCKFCDHCNRLRLTSTGEMKYCLHSNEETNLRPFLEDISAMEEAILQAVKLKPRQHQLEEGYIISRNMVEVGG